jgi:hypothetical protein
MQNKNADGDFQALSIYVTQGNKCPLEEVKEAQHYIDS